MTPFKMSFLFIMMVTVFCSSCYRTDKFPAKEQYNAKEKDSLTALSSAVKAFNEDERAALDSVKKYLLDSINQKCKSVIYVLHGNDTLTGSYRNELVTLGECNIRLIRFENISENLKCLWYNVFVNDSIPVIWLFNTRISEKEIIHGFVVDVKRNKLQEAKISAHESMKIEDALYAYDTTVKSNKFKNYLLNYKTRISPNFIIPKEQQ